MRSLFIMMFNTRNKSGIFAHPRIYYSLFHLLTGSLLLCSTTRAKDKLVANSEQQRIYVQPAYSFRTGE
jgi:hypothetical protein